MDLKRVDTSTVALEVSVTLNILAFLGPDNTPQFLEIKSPLYQQRKGWASGQSGEEREAGGHLVCSLLTAQVLGETCLSSNIQHETIFQYDPYPKDSFSSLRMNSVI